MKEHMLVSFGQKKGVMDQAGSGWSFVVWYEIRTWHSVVFFAMAGFNIGQLDLVGAWHGIA